MANEFSKYKDHAVATLQAKASGDEFMGVQGHYYVTCHDKDGNLKWEEGFPNLVVAAGKQILLDTLLTGSSYTVVGPYIGFISNSFTPLAADTMSSHTWIEFTNYLISGLAVRGTATFSASTSAGASPSNVTTSTAAPITCAITGAGGTVYGVFMVLGPGAVNTQGSSAGTLYSEGLFAAAKTTTAGDTLTINYSTTATS